MRGASTKEEILDADNDEMAEGLDICFDGGSECRKMLIDELDDLDRDLTVSIDIDFHLNPDHTEDYEISWRVSYTSLQATLLHDWSLLTYHSSLPSAQHQKDLGASRM